MLMGNLVMILWKPTKYFTEEVTKVRRDGKPYTEGSRQRAYEMMIGMEYLSINPDIIERYLHVPVGMKDLDCVDWLIRARIYAIAEIIGKHMLGQNLTVPSNRYLRTPRSIPPIHPNIGGMSRTFINILYSYASSLRHHYPKQSQLLWKYINMHFIPFDESILSGIESSSHQREWLTLKEMRRRIYEAEQTIWRYWAEGLKK